ncbi:MAG TPA: serine/threonine-protein kinase [Polyangiaceae bacterium]
MSSSPPIPLLGRAGAYELLVEVASGGMATVYLARGPGEGGILVAVKRPHRHLASDPVFAAMFSDEARLASAIHHRNVVKVRELGFDSAPGPRGPVPEPFLVLDYVEGASLSDLRKELAAAKRAVDTRVAVRIIVDALAGLHAAHELRDENGKLLGIIHRDVSPHNVLVGSDGISRLTDFGIAKAEDNVQVTRTHEVKGKLAYLAPERVDKRRTCNVQSDVFSMAVVLWECLAGRRLFRGEEAIDTLDEVMNATIPRLRQLGADIPVALDEAIAKGLERDLAKRWKTARELGEAIEHAAGNRWIGRPEDVGRVVEAMFGARLRVRHQQIREAVGDERATRLFARSHLPERPVPRAEPLTPDTAILSAIAPEAPSGRYVMGSLPALKKERKWVLPLVVGVVSGLAVGTLGLTYLVRSEPEEDVHTARRLAPVHLSAGKAAPTSGVSTAGTTVAELPAIELDEDAGVRPSGTRKKPAPIGTVRNGFTKLK